MQFLTGNCEKPTETGKYYIKLDSKTLPFYTDGCFADATEMLLKILYVFNLAFPYKLKQV